MSNPRSKARKLYNFFYFFIRVTCSNINLPTVRPWVRMLDRVKGGGSCVVVKRRALDRDNKEGPAFGQNIHTHFSRHPKG